MLRQALLMPTSPEIKSQTSAPPPPEGAMVQERPETFIVPEQIQQIATSTPTQVTVQVTDDSGQPLIQPTAIDPAIQIPIDPVASEKWRKWSLSDTITWFTVFWLRAAKKATHLGKKIVFVGRKDK